MIASNFSNPSIAKSHVSHETRLQAVQAVLQGLPRSEAALIYGVDRATICRWMLRYRVAGEKGLSRKKGSGRPRGTKKEPIPADASPDFCRQLTGG